MVTAEFEPRVIFDPELPLWGFEREKILVSFVAVNNSRGRQFQSIFGESEAGSVLDDLEQVRKRLTSREHRWEGWKAVIDSIMYGNQWSPTHYFGEPVAQVCDDVQKRIKRINQKYERVGSRWEMVRVGASSDGGYPIYAWLKK